MRLLTSNIGKLLLVSGLSLAVTFAVCILYVPMQGPPGPKTAAKPLPPKSRTQAIFLEHDFEPRLLEEVPEDRATWGRHANCTGGGPQDGRVASYYLNMLECHVSTFIFTFIGGLLAFLVAVALNVVWHWVRHWHQRRSFLRELSMGVIILNILYCERFPEWVQNNPVLTTGFVVCFEAIIFRVIEYFMFLEKALATDSKQELTGVTDSKQELKDLEVVNRYQLPTSSFTTLFFLFVCQMTLSMFYIYSLNNYKKGWADSSGWRWFLGLLLCNLAGEDEVGHDFQFTFWLKLLHTKDRRMQHVPSMMFFVKIEDFKKEVCVRMCMSMCVNMFTRRIIFLYRTDPSEHCR